MAASGADVTQLLQAWCVGRQDALDKLLPAIYGELRRLAASYLRRERRDHTLQPTALVHEAFLKLVDQRGSGERPLSLDEALIVSPATDIDLLALDEALTRLAAIDPQQGRVVELRFFGGLTIDETAEVLHISAATVGREWTLAKAWLFAELGPGTA